MSIDRPFEIRQALPQEYARLGELTVEVYAALPGMPGPAEQPDYYAMLRDVAGRAATPTTDLLVAVTPDGELLGGVTYVGEMRYYKSGGTATSVTDAAGIRLLAIAPDARGLGAGRALTEACIHRAKTGGRSQVVLHTTKAMQVAWGLYERMGFRRSPDLDFSQGDLEVFGFRLPLPGRD